MGRSYLCPFGHRPYTCFSSKTICNTGTPKNEKKLIRTQCLRCYLLDKACITSWSCDMFVVQAENKKFISLKHHYKLRTHCSLHVFWNVNNILNMFKCVMCYKPKHLCLECRQITMLHLTKDRPKTARECWGEFEIYIWNSLTNFHTVRCISSVFSNSNLEKHNCQFQVL